MDSAFRERGSSALDRKDEWSATPLNRGPLSHFPPDPARFFGGILVRAALEQQEQAEDQGRPVGSVVRAIANLAPAGVRKGG